jgi:16S rRNA (guanine966-N2)-methyltransferase
MRVISGTAKRLQLKSPEGLNTRPTTDRIKETLFNMISTDIYDCSFLDLFSGSGAIGIEALSRGAKQAIFIENNNKALKCLRENLVHTKLSSKAQVIPKDVMLGLKTLDNQDGKEQLGGKEGLYFDIVFIDPPYDEGLEKKVLEFLADSSIINSESTIIVEAGLETSFDYLEEIGLVLAKDKCYKSNRHVFISLKITR